MYANLAIVIIEICNSQFPLIHFLNVHTCINVLLVTVLLILYCGFLQLLPSSSSSLRVEFWKPTRTWMIGTNYWGNGTSIWTYETGKYPVLPLTVPSYQFSSIRLTSIIVSPSCKPKRTYQLYWLTDVDLKWSKNIYLETQFARILGLEIV